MFFEKYGIRLVKRSADVCTLLKRIEKVQWTFLSWTNSGEFKWKIVLHEVHQNKNFVFFSSPWTNTILFALSRPMLLKINTMINCLKLIFLAVLSSTLYNKIWFENEIRRTECLGVERALVTMTQFSQFYTFVLKFCCLIINSWRWLFRFISSRLLKNGWTTNPLHMKANIITTFIISSVSLIFSSRIINIVECEDLFEIS